MYTRAMATHGMLTPEKSAALDEALARQLAARPPRGRHADKRLAWWIAGGILAAFLPLPVALGLIAIMVCLSL